MKGFFRKVIDTFQQKPNLSQATQFFKKVQGTQTSFKNASNPQIIDKIDNLNRIIVKGQQKDFVMLRIRQLITESQLGHNISPKIQDACEVVHYALINNTPVLISKVKLLHPQFDLSDQIIINEQEFEKQSEEKYPELKQEVEIDSFAQRDQTEYYDEQRHRWKESQKSKRR